MPQLLDILDHAVEAICSGTLDASMVLQSHLLIPREKLRVRLLDFRLGLLGGPWGQQSGAAALQAFWAANRAHGLGFMVMGVGRDAEVWRVPVGRKVRRFVVEPPPVKCFRAEMAVWLEGAVNALATQHESPHRDSWRPVVVPAHVLKGEVKSPEHLKELAHKSAQRRERLREAEARRSRRRRQRQREREARRLRRLGIEPPPPRRRRRPKQPTLSNLVARAAARSGRRRRMLDKAVQATHLVPGGRYDAGVRERIETVIRKQEERLVNSAVSAAMRSVKPVRTGLLPADETSGRFLAWLESGAPLPAGTPDADVARVALGALQVAGGVVPRKNPKVRYDQALLDRAAAYVAFLRVALVETLPMSIHVGYQTFMRQFSAGNPAQLAIDLTCVLLVRSCEYQPRGEDLFQPGWTSEFSEETMSALNVALRAPWESESDSDWGPATLTDLWGRLRAAGYPAPKHHYTDGRVRLGLGDRTLLPAPRRAVAVESARAVAPEQARTEVAELLDKRGAYFGPESYPELLAAAMAHEFEDVDWNDARDERSFWVSMGWGDGIDRLRDKLRRHLQEVRAIDDRLWELGRGLDDLPSAGWNVQQAFNRRQDPEYHAEVQQRLCDRPGRGDGCDPRSDWAMKWDHPMLGKRRT